MKKLSIIFFLLVGLLGVFVVYTYVMEQQKKVLGIRSFEECADAGYSILNSYPPQCLMDDGRSFTQDIGNSMKMREEIRITAPVPHTVISEWLEVTGEAKADWFYAGMFTGELIDGNEKRLAQVRLYAGEKTQNQEFIPFSGKIDIDTPTTETGTLILRNANSSGRAEDDKALIVPVKF